MNTNKAYKSGVTTLSAQFGGSGFSSRALFLQLISLISIIIIIKSLLA